MVPRRLALAAVLLLAAACARPREVVVFHAVSLSPLLGELERAFARAHPGWRLRLEPSGSLIAARKVSELGLRADLVLSADEEALQRLLWPAHVDGVLRFASNELVLAHREHSRHTAEITAANWPELVLRDDVRLGRVDPGTGPLGYHTLCLWQLAGLQGEGAPADLAARLRAKIPAARLVPDEDQLIALLEARAIDYAFVYRSTALTHHLKLLRLPPALNLAAQDRAADYARASTPLRAGGGEVARRCAPVRFGLAIPRNAPQPEAARQVLALLLSDAGAQLLERYGFTPVRPAIWLGAALPPALGALGVVDESAATSSPAGAATSAAASAPADPRDE